MLLAMSDPSVAPRVLGEMLPSATMLALVLVPMALLGLGLGLGASLLALATGGLLRSRA